MDHAYATAADLAHLYRRPIGTIYRWASVDKWRRIQAGHRRYYHREDCQRSYDLRHRPPGLPPC